MWLLDQLAEARIDEALARGELNDLSGVGQPLMLEDDTMVPEELRVAYRILKNAGCVPPQVELLREVHDIESLLRGVNDEPERRALWGRLQLVSMRLRAAGGREAGMFLDQGYFDKLQRAFASS
jgi:hypothetical protein